MLPYVYPPAPPEDAPPPAPRSESEIVFQLEPVKSNA